MQVIPQIMPEKMDEKGAASPEKTDEEGAVGGIEPRKIYDIVIDKDWSPAVREYIKKEKLLDVDELGNLSTQDLKKLEANLQAKKKKKTQRPILKLKV